MTEIVLLYALSTLAQTCAALAAFVGAIGVFRLQLLRDQRKDVERGLRLLTDGLGTVGRDVMLVPMWAIQRGIEEGRKRHGENDQRVQAVLQEQARWEAFVPHVRRSRGALIVFEVWNLFAIGASLAGFSIIAPLTGIWWVPWLFAAASVGTIILTLLCVVVWTRRAEG